MARLMINSSVCGTTYTNSTPDIISVDSNGLVKALNPGKAEVRATNSGLSVNLLVYVIEDYLPHQLKVSQLKASLGKSC